MGGTFGALAPPPPSGLQLLPGGGALPEGDSHSFSKRWKSMPSRPTDLQKVYVEELFFFGHSLRICSREGERHALTVYTRAHEHAGTLVNTHEKKHKHTCTFIYLGHIHTHTHTDRHAYIHIHTYNTRI